MTYVTHLPHFLGDDGHIPKTLPTQARRLAEFLGSIVSGVSSDELGGPAFIKVRCRRRPNRKPCSGEIVAIIFADTMTIEWECPLCGDNGVITGWSGSMWDCRGRCEARLQ